MVAFSAEIIWVTQSVSISETADPPPNDLNIEADGLLASVSETQAQLRTVPWKIKEVLKAREGPTRY